MSLEQRPPRLTPTIELKEIVGEFVSASNLTLLARDDRGRPWVYKAERGMAPLWDFAAASLPRRELAAYLVSEAAGFNVVPETHWALGSLGPGSVQAFLELDLDFDPTSLVSPRVDPALWDVAVFDLVCNNADRKLGHLLRANDSERIWAIDNGLTFHVDSKLRTVLWGLAGQPLPAAQLAALERLELALTGTLPDRLAVLLDPREVIELGTRIDALIADPVHPLPPMDRPAWPWPAW